MTPMYDLMLSSGMCGYSKFFIKLIRNFCCTCIGK